MRHMDHPEGSGTIRQLRPPGPDGFMDPHALLRTVASVDHALGSAASDAMLEAAGIGRLPGAEEPVREDKVRRCHDAIRSLWPEKAPALLRAAGEGFAAEFCHTRITTRARRMLGSAPWPLAAWLIGQRLKQVAWSVFGSGRLEVHNAMTFEVFDNPLARGAPPGSGCLCAFYAAFFAGLYGPLIDNRLTAQETACMAEGHAACRFAVGLREDQG